MLSSRLQQIVDALPLRPGLRVIEIGPGPGGAAIEVARRIGPDGHVLAVDRSATAIAQLGRAAADLIESGRLSVCHAAVEDFELTADERRYDLAFAVRVGALDGRHPELEARAIQRIRSALTLEGRLFIDGGSPLREIQLGAS